MSAAFTNPSPAAIRALLGRVRTVACVGASANTARPSNQVLAWMLTQGYDMIPVNPGLAGQRLHGQVVVADLRSIERPIDMVQVFRAADALYGIAEAAIDAGAGVLWGQLGVVDNRATELALNAGLQVVMDRCPKIELERI